MRNKTTKKRRQCPACYQVTTIIITERGITETWACSACGVSTVYQVR